MNDILIRPLITEKMTIVNEKLPQKYGFLVNLKANKLSIAKAIEDKFNVNVVDVNTIRYKGKTRTQFRKSGRFVGKTSRYKKAIVTIKEGEKIDLFDQV